MCLSLRLRFLTVLIKFVNSYKIQQIKIGRQLKRILRHFKGTTEYGVHQRKFVELDLVAFYDAD